MVTKIKPYRIRDVNEPEEGNSLQYNDHNTFVRGEGGGGGGEYTAGEGISIGQGLDYSAMRGPCDFGFHIPTVDEAQFLLTISQRSNSQLPGSWVKAPNNGYIKFQNPNIYASWTRWTCTASSNTGEDHHTNAYMLCYDNSGYMPAQPLAPTDKSYGCGIRAFKDNPVIPDETWTILGQNLRGAFYWNETLGLITAHNTDTNQYVTLQDKNVGATNVGDNGLYFQWGNNQGFTSASAATSHTRVDASGYEPSTYAADPINTSYDWSSEENDNLWGGVTGVVTIDNVISNTGVLSVNGQTGHVTVESGGKQSFFKTQDEYDALPASKESDGNLYIIVDTHIHFMPFEELIELTPAPNAILAELNKDGKGYAEYYYGNGDIDMNEAQSSELPRADAYLKQYNFSNIDNYLFLDTNLTEQELIDSDYFTQEQIEAVLAGEWFFIRHEEE